MSEIVLVRHAQASFGAADYDRLSPLGHEQAQWLGEYFTAHELRFQQVIHGSLRRHRETVKGILAAVGRTRAVADDRLDEFHYFGLEQEYIRETGTNAAANRESFLEIFPEIFTRWEEGRIGGEGETYAAFQARVDAALDEAVAVAAGSGRAVLVVTSGGVIGVILRRVLGLSARVAAELLLNIHNASVHRLVMEGGRLRLSLFNASPHLDPRDRSHARTYV